MKILSRVKKENISFALILGLCSALAVTTTFENAYLMSLCVFIVFIISSGITILLKNTLKDSNRVIAILIINAILVSILEIALKEFIPLFYEAAKIYLPLIIIINVNLSNKYDKLTIKSTLKTGMYFILTISLLGLIREILGSNTITLMNYTSSLTGYKAIYEIFPTNDIIPMPFFISAAGAFLTLGVLMAIFAKGDVHNESN